MKRYFHASIFLLLAVYLTWHGVFESSLLPNKIDTHIHLFRIENWIDALKQGSLFPAWHPGPFFGYPEDFNYILTYLSLIIPSLLLGVPKAIKLSFIVYFFLAGISFRSFMKKMKASDDQAFLAACLYMGSASFVNFGLGSGSITRIAGIAFYPFLVTQFLNWYSDLSRRKSLLLILSFYASYLVHPVCALGGIFTFLVFMLTQRPGGPWKVFFRECAFIVLASAPLFAWQLGSLFLFRKYISWDEVYGFYRQFLLDINLSSFFGFWMSAKERMYHFYLGFFPLGLTFISLIWWKKDAQKFLKTGITLALSSMAVILAGKYILKMNTYRFDLVYSLGTAICASFVLEKIKFRTISMLIVLFIVVEQTWYARPFAGGDYVDVNRVKIIKAIAPAATKSERFIIGPSLMDVVNKMDVTKASPDNGIHYHGFFELTAGQLGMVPFVREIKNPSHHLRYFGLSDIHSPSTGRASYYKKFLILKARTFRESFREVYRPLIEESSYFPDKMPLVYEEADSDPLIESFDGTLKIIPAQDKDWKQKVISFFDNQETGELEEFVTSPGHLVILKESFHPRVKTFPEMRMQMAQPGLIAILSPKKSPPTKLKLEYAFTTLEKLLGLISLLSLLVMGSWVLFKKTAFPEVK